MLKLFAKWKINKLQYLKSFTEDVKSDWKGYKAAYLRNRTGFWKLVQAGRKT